AHRIGRDHDLDAVVTEPGTDLEGGGRLLWVDGGGREGDPCAGHPVGTAAVRRDPYGLIHDSKAYVVTGGTSPRKRERVSGWSAAHRRSGPLQSTRGDCGPSVPLGAAWVRPGGRSVSGRDPSGSRAKA